MVCKDCGQNKPLSEFYKHPGMTNRVLGSCKVCRKDYARARYQLNMQDSQWVDKERQRQLTKTCSPTGLTRMRRWCEENPEKYRAHRALNHAIRGGKIIKPLNCEHCGRNGIIHGHHMDYSRPLDVMWLCVKCHHKLY